jgi:hypothetical protein
LPMPRKRRSYFLNRIGEPIPGSKVNKLSLEDQIGLMRYWFDDRYASPDDLPYDSGEGGYQWIWGGPYDARDALENEFSGIASDEAIETLVSELEDIGYEWSGKPDDSDFDQSYLSRWYPDDPDDPFTALMTTVVQIEGVAVRRRNKADEVVLYPLLFVNIITALETYLGDVFAALLFSRRDFFERFVHNNGRFQAQEIRLNQLFKRLATIDTEVKTVVSNNTWHNLIEAAKWYKQAFGVKLPEPTAVIRAAIPQRHDIVHRNGKSPDGVVGTWGVEQIKALSKDVMEYASEIEDLLKSLPRPSTAKGAPPEDPGEI